MSSSHRRLLAECIGTYALIFVGPGAVIVDGMSGGALGPVGVGICFALVIFTMVQSMGPISGAHINPAVTISLAAAGKFPWNQVPGYIVAQCLGALAGALSLKMWFPTDQTALGSTLPHIGVGASFSLELVLSCLLMLVIYRVIAQQEQQPQASTLMPALTIGAVVGMEATFAGPACGASMNPARSLGPALVSAEPRALASLWIYLTAPVLGTLVALLLNKALQESASTFSNEHEAS